MTTLELYGTPGALPGSAAGRIAMLLGFDRRESVDDVGLADAISRGLRATAADTLSEVLGRSHVVGPLIPEATLRRARKNRTALSREMSERLYEVGRVVDAVSRLYHGDRVAITRFLEEPHRLLGGRTPLAMAQSSSAGAEAVINLLQRADAGFAV
jgi:putative toxin-antitoxin system antitoxin component (TIGR02293 family)